MIAVVCYLWSDDRFSDSRHYEPKHVNLLAKKVKENLIQPHRFVCITDEEGFSDDVEVMPLPEEARQIAAIPTAENHSRFPTCYRRLWTLSEGAKVLGDSVLVLDIDCLIVGPLDPLFDYLPDADFVGWNPVQAWGQTRVAGGTWRHRPGTRTEVWEGFSQKEAKRLRSLGYRGSDQAVLSAHLGNEPVFPPGWIMNRQEFIKLRDGVLPAETKILHFNGTRMPWDQKEPLFREYYAG